MILNKSINVDKDLFEMFRSFIKNKRVGRFKEGDSNSFLEVNLCQYIFNTQNVKKASLNEDIKKDIDCYINNIPTQVKCRKDNRLTIELYKYRNFKKINGWLDRNKDNNLQFVFIWWENDIENKLHYSIFSNQELQRLSRICQEKFLNKKEISKDDSDWIKKYFFNLDFVKFVDSEVDKQSGDSSGSYFYIQYC